jgi:hypothetical protein
VLRFFQLVFVSSDGCFDQRRSVILYLRLLISLHFVCVVHFLIFSGSSPESRYGQQSLPGVEEQQRLELIIAIQLFSQGYPGTGGDSELCSHGGSSGTTHVSFSEDRGR